MSHQVKFTQPETQKIVAMKFHTNIPRRSPKEAVQVSNRFPDVEQVAADIFRKVKLRHV